MCEMEENEVLIDLNIHVSEPRLKCKKVGLPISFPAHRLLSPPQTKQLKSYIPCRIFSLLSFNVL